MNFLHNEWDDALMGYVERAPDGDRGVTSCYGYQALKSMTNKKAKSPEEAYKMFSNLVYNTPKYNKPLIVSRLTRKALWDKIMKESLPRWEHLDKAIIGLGYAGWKLSGVVYNKNLCLELLRRDQSVNETNPMKIESSLREWLEESVIPISLGKHTPWFLTPVK